MDNRGLIVTSFQGEIHREFPQIGDFVELDTGTSKVWNFNFSIWTHLLWLSDLGNSLITENWVLQSLSHQ